MTSGTPPATRAGERKAWPALEFLNMLPKLRSVAQKMRNGVGASHLRNRSPQLHSLRGHSAARRILPILRKEVAKIAHDAKAQ